MVKAVKNAGKILKSSFESLLSEPTLEKVLCILYTWLAKKMATS